MYNIKKIREAGGFAVVVYPSGFNEFKQFILDLMHDNFSREMKEVIK